LRHRGKWLASEDNGLYLEHSSHSKAIFQIKQLHDDVVELKSYHDRFVAMDSGGGVYMTHHHHDTDTRFHLEHRGGQVAFRNHGKYLGVDMFHSKVRGHHELGSGELFDEIFV